MPSRHRDHPIDTLLFEESDNRLQRRFARCGWSRFALLIGGYQACRLTSGWTWTGYSGRDPNPTLSSIEG